MSILFDYLESGEIDEFKEGYPDVSDEQVHAVLRASQAVLAERLLVGSLL